MNSTKLRKLKLELTRLRRAQVTAANIESVARQLGRKKVNRGKEPMWESCFPHLFVLAIPHHGGRDIPTGTKHSILNQLEEDVLAWDETLREVGDEDENGQDEGC